ncbi:hypothetical protein Tco_0807402 [Tanacetum coccineum]
MADLTFADSHNMVAYLEKSEANADFAEIVDFLNASSIRYAITLAATSKWSGEWYRGHPTDTTNQKSTYYTTLYPSTVETNPTVQHKCGKEMPLSLDAKAGHWNGSGWILICQEARAIPLLRLESLGEKDASKQGRNSDKIEELNVAEDEHMFELSDLASTEIIVDQEETIKLVEDKGSAKKGVGTIKDKDSTVDLVTTGGETVTTVVDVSVADDVTLAETLMAIRSSVMQEPVKPMKVKGKDQIEYDVDIAQRLQVELDEEARLEREKEEGASNAALIEEYPCSLNARH